MWIVTFGAGEHLFTTEVAAGLSQPVGGAREFKSIFGIPGISAIEMQDVVSKRFARPIQGETSIVPLKNRRQPETGGLEVTLHA